MASLELANLLTSRLAAWGVRIAAPCEWIGSLALRPSGPPISLLSFFFLALAWRILWLLRETGGEQPAANRRPKMLQLSARFDSHNIFGHQYSSAAHLLGDYLYEAPGLAFV